MVRGDSVGHTRCNQVKEVHVQAVYVVEHGDAEECVCKVKTGEHGMVEQSRSDNVCDTEQSSCTRLLCPGTERRC